MLKRMQIGAVALAVGALLCCPMGASANLLVNPSFEIDDDANGMPDGWGKWEPDYNNTGYVVHVDYTTDAAKARTGDNLMVTWQWTNYNPEPGWDFGLFAQTDIPAVPGETYTSGIWIDNNWGDGGQTSGNGAFLKMEFFDAGGTRVGYMVEDQDILPDGFHFYSISMEAPAGTTTVDVAYAGNGGYDWMRSMAFDDAVLTPEPASMFLLALGGFALLRRR